jgi:hypothetical protein
MGATLQNARFSDMLQSYSRLIVHIVVRTKSHNQWGRQDVLMIVVDRSAKCLASAGNLRQGLRWRTTIVRAAVVQG